MMKRTSGRKVGVSTSMAWRLMRPCPRLLLFPLFFFLLYGCSGGGEKTENRVISRPEPASSPQNVTTSAPNMATRGCESCHGMEMDAAHAFSCTTCHQGIPDVANEEEAHTGLVAQPAHPKNMAKGCGGCHHQVREAGHSIHFTLAREVNLVRSAFGARNHLASLLEIPLAKRPSTPLELADDLLRRRCLICHVYSSGQPYEKTSHGTGCAACHLEFTAGKLKSHRFLRKPTDDQCLSCHYGNFVGADYYGRFETDLNTDYRMPYQPDGTPPRRPFGVEYHQLEADVHQRAGMACIDCHSGAELMGLEHESNTAKRDERTACLVCHGWQQQEPLPPGYAVKASDGQLFLVTKHSRHELAIPRLRHPAHQARGEKVRCTVCHAQWTYYDKGTWLLRLDRKDYDPWAELVTQGNIEAEAQLLEGVSGSKFNSPFMSDGVTKESWPGVWLKSFEMRRWEPVPSCTDESGLLAVCRPVLDLHLSWVDADGSVIFDGVAIEKEKNVLQPYTPHTIGKAGAFWQARLGVHEHE